MPTVTRKTVEECKDDLTGYWYAETDFRMVFPASVPDSAGASASAPSNRFISVDPATCDTIQLSNLLTFVDGGRGTKQVYFDKDMMVLIRKRLEAAHNATLQELSRASIHRPSQRENKPTSAAQLCDEVLTIVNEIIHPEPEVIEEVSEKELDQAMESFTLQSNKLFGPKQITVTWRYN